MSLFQICEHRREKDLVLLNDSGSSVVKLKAETCLGDAGHHEGHLRHDGKMHVPGPQGGDAPAARGGLLPGRWTANVLPDTTASLSVSVFCLQQKMDKNKDGVVTIDEFIDCCQNVRQPSRIGPQWAGPRRHAVLCFRRMKTS